MGLVLVAMPKLADSQRIADIIRNSEIPADPVTCTTGSEILRKVEDTDVDLVVGTKAFSDMGFEELLNYLPPNVKYVLLTKDTTLNYYCDNLVKLLMPFKPSDFISTLMMLLPDMVYRSRRKPKRSEKEQEVIDEAKRVLMDRNEMTEPEAFRYIQKTSMDTGRTMIESAQMILMLNSE
ncbi:MAG: ANTAR domain-containing protein [Lachnospiraceae bacterium]|nr:ANTAR domain-containing protein [Lachnospiraceae bacterium]